jgi:tetratricopeptide (TPR) repeat protein
MIDPASRSGDMQWVGRVTLAGAAMILAAILATPAPAQTQEQIDWCVNQTRLFSFDQRISGCTAAIQSGKSSGQGLAWAFSKRCWAYLDYRDLDRALVDCDEAIRLDPTLAAAFNNRAGVYGFKGDFDRAWADLNTAIRLDPTFAGALNNRANVYRMKGDVDAAILDQSEAIRLDPNFMEAFVDRGLAYEAKGDLDRARADFNTALSMAPKYFSPGRSAHAHDVARERLRVLGQRNGQPMSEPLMKRPERSR